mgnify:CR=1 FL=1
MRLMFAALFAAILAAPLPVTAQDADTEKSPPAAQETSPETEPKIDVTRNGDWEVACQEVEFEGKTTKTCEMRQILVQKETQKEWLRVAVSFTPDTKKPILRNGFSMRYAWRARPAAWLPARWTTPWSTC